LTIEIPAASVETTGLSVRVAIPTEMYGAWDALRNVPSIKKSSQMLVRLSRPRRPRTTGYRSQNHHLNGHIQQIASYTGDSFDDVKGHIKREAIADGYPIRTTSWGEAVPQSESDASSFECGLLIEAAHRVASFLGATLKESG